MPLFIGYSRAGLTKVPIDGQPRSIVRDLEEMARTYIKVGSLKSVVPVSSSSSSRPSMNEAV